MKVMQDAVGKTVADLIINLIIVCAEAYSLAVCFFSCGAKSFAYYTNLSNFLAFLASLVCAVCLIKTLFVGDIPDFAVKLKFFAATSLAVTVGVVLFALFPILLFSENFSTGESVRITLPSLLLHLVCPLLTFVSFVFFEKVTLSFPLVIFAALPTLFYGLLMLFLNYIGTVSGPYPFFEVRLHPSLAAVCCPLIPLAAFLFAFLFSLKSRSKTKKVPE